MVIYTPHRGRRAWLITGLVSGLAVVVAAVLLWPSPEDGLLQWASGGEGTTRSEDPNAFGNSARNLTNEERRRFEVGDSFFTQNWVTAPASTDARDGLGPLMNAQSCSSCHLRDGRGTPDGVEPGLLLRLSAPGDYGPEDDPTYGDQIQDRAILGIPPEATIRTIYTEVEGVYDDGKTYTLRRPVHELEDLGYGPISVDVMVSARLAPPVFGAGLLEAIPESDIVAAADPEDADNDGISGRPNYVTSLTTGDRVLGRFGWKANVASVADQVAGAFLGDVGITSDLLPAENCTVTQVECVATPNGGTPEIGSEVFSDVVFYNETLAVPGRRNLESSAVTAGAGAFLDIGCASCHTPSHTTGEDEIAALADQIIYPYTDLLIHDMGPDLADDRPDGEASGIEWRTPPLWGLGLNGVVNGHEFFLHDGRARSVEEAILWHGGEAEASRNRFKSLDLVQRTELLEFLESL